MISTREMMDMSMEDICNTAHKNNWDVGTLEAWSIFKIAQYHERIAYEKGGE